MVWPTDPETLTDIPMTPGGRELAGIAGSDTVRVVCGYVMSHGVELERITEGDESKEQQLGDLLVGISTMAANVHERIIQGHPTI